MSTPPVDPTPAPAPLPALLTPDPVLTTESFAALAAVIVPGLLVLFHFQVSATTKAAILSALGAIYAAFTLWHAGRVRAARAISKGLSAGGSGSASVKL